MANPPRVTNVVPQGCLAAVFFGGLALILWPLFVALHRNYQSGPVRLETQAR